MRVLMTVVMDDEQRRRVRASMGRGGKATRAEVRVWMQRVLGIALKTAPEPRRRRPSAPKTAPLPLPEAPAVKVTDETRCKNCGLPFRTHGFMLRTCLPGFGAPLGARFLPAACDTGGIMLIDITTQAVGYDCRVQPIRPVRLPPSVMEVRHNTKGSTRIDIVRGDRPVIAQRLRAAGYEVEYEDGNPWRAIGSKSTPAKREAARINGRLSAGRPRSVSRLVTSPQLLSELARLSKGELIDVIAEAARRDVQVIRVLVQTALQHRAQQAAKAVSGAS